MPQRIPLDSSILNSGQARHFQRWEFPGVPRIKREAERRPAAAERARRVLGKLFGRMR